MPEIDFACQRFPVENIVMCSFGIAETDYKVLIYLFTHENKTINEIAKALGKERSTIQKSINKLFERDIIERRQKNLSEGGYKFTYSAKDKDNVKEKISSVLDSWVLNVKKEIKNW